MPATAKRQNQAGYDLAVFEKQAVRQPSTLRVVRRSDAVQRDIALKAALCFVIALAVSAMIIYNYMTLNELTSEINKAKSQYEELQGEYRRLMVESESQLSIRKIEERARNQGMAPIESYQINYVQLEDEHVALAQMPPTIFDQIKSVIDGFKEYLDK